MIPAHRQIRPTLCGFITTVLMANSQFALGQTSNPDKLAKANTLVEEAGALRDAGNVAEACHKLEQAERLVPDGIGVHWALGRCYESIGRLGIACQQYEASEQYARLYDDPIRLKNAAVKRGEICERAATLVIHTTKVQTEIQAILAIDDRAAAIVAGRIWRKVDQGEHVVKVGAPGHKQWVMHLRVADGDHIEVDAPMLEPLITKPLEPAGSVPLWRENLGKPMVIAPSALSVVGGLVALVSHFTSDKTFIEDAPLVSCGVAMIATGAITFAGGILLAPSHTPQSKTAQAQWHVGVNPNGFSLRAHW